MKNSFERPPMPEQEKEKIETEEVGEEESLESPETLIENGEGEKESYIQKVRQEGEMALFRLFQGIDKATGRKHHPEKLRKILLEFKKPITDMESYRETREETSMNKVLIPAMEVVYGALSLGARETVKGMLKATASFGRGAANLSEQASKRFEDAKKLYKMEDKEDK